ncbi:MAG TPA: antibiotic biosynthesis monooxygenase [Sporichthyaceae bacterium]|jgi:quinol monooxygenase YgiN|nr:antibiotic biosynthesis monooxygenase [Sporichthyaceae bacterium]
MMVKQAHTPLEGLGVRPIRSRERRRHITRRPTGGETVTTVTPTLTVSFVVKLVAKQETADEVAAFLAEAIGPANEEAGTIVWLALRTDHATFWIVDAFPDEAARQAHLTGRIAAALMANAERLPAAAPEILHADVLAAKVP